MARVLQTLETEQMSESEVKVCNQLDAICGQRKGYLCREKNVVACGPAKVRGMPAPSGTMEDPETEEQEADRKDREFERISTIRRKTRG